MSDEKLSERKHVLLNLLEIAPYESRLIRELSGGQQRRVRPSINHSNSHYNVL